MQKSPLGRGESYLKRMSTKKLVEENSMIRAQAQATSPSATVSPSRKKEQDNISQSVFEKKMAPAKKESFLKRQGPILREG